MPINPNSIFKKYFLIKFNFFKSYFFNFIFFVYLFFSLFIQPGCSSFQGPQSYRGQSGSYKKHSRGYKSPVYQSPRWYSGNRKNFKRLTGTPHFIWPISKAKLTQKFSPSHNPSHSGLDLANSRGTPIMASHTGTIVFAGRKYRGYGKMVIIEYNDHWATLYAHLDKIYVKNGEWIQKGEVLGTMGDTGRATGVHLHFELMEDKMPVDPLGFLE